MTVFTKAARVVGDLDDDFYRDERQRDVWNEASAVGFQLCQWIGLTAAALLPWVAGRPGAWTALGLLIAWFVVSAVTMAYAGSRDVDLYTTTKLLRPRVVAAGLLYIAAAFGIFARLEWEGGGFDQDSATWAGRIVGAAVGLAPASVVLVWYRRRVRRRETQEDAREAKDL
ncbi:DUF2029 domain-containing protein [Rhodococcus chondri]|uniref:DUF2029 domain-containing protein n=1 Tax=Rhodococcus chondri TaxID=3065941 RepID=A0ABU7JXY8_9NOCA|nr:DUF2029 domain-containing protein [Rhodococcus sp. CC-R104]MEE2034394.1 DUF2029 domain-containing protein [Rhodococcus sp. CC-R104]